MIAFEASGLLTTQPTGVATYGRALLQALLDFNDSHESSHWRLVYPVSRWCRRALLSDIGIPTRPYFAGLTLPTRSSLVHLLDTRLPTQYRGPIVATVFDTIAALPVSRDKGLSSERFRQRKLRAYEMISKRADVVITLSDAVRSEFLQRFPQTRRVEVIPPGVSVPPSEAHESGDLEALRPFAIRKPFLLALGALCPRKNLEAVVRAFELAREEQDNLQLVLMGAEEYGWCGSHGQQAVEACQAPVVVTGYLSRAVVWAALRQAACLLQLSHYEGYGLTALESMAVGTPVIASPRGGLPEAVGDAGWLVEPEDTDSVQRVILRILAADDRVSEKIRKGQSRAGACNWARAARAVRALHLEIASGV